MTHQWHRLFDGAIVPGRNVIGFAPQRIVSGDPPQGPSGVGSTLWANHEETAWYPWPPTTEGQRAGG